MTLAFPAGTSITAISQTTDALTLFIAKPADLWFNSWSPASGAWGHWTSILANEGVRQKIAAVSMFPGKVDMVGKVQITNPAFSKSWRLDAWKLVPKQEWCYMGDMLWRILGLGYPLNLFAPIVDGGSEMNWLR